MRHFRKSCGSTKKAANTWNHLFKEEKSFFFGSFDKQICWKRSEKGKRRRSTTLKDFKHHLPSLSRIFVEQVFKIPHRYVHFIPLFFYLFHGLFERFLQFFLAYFFDYFFAYFFAIFFFYFAIDFQVQKYEKQSQCKRGV